MCNQLRLDHGWLPEQTLTIPVVQFWLVFKLSENRRPHDHRSIQECWNQKFRIAKGLAPLNFG